MTHYERLRKKRLGDLLVDEGLVAKDTVIAALHEQQVSGRLLSEILLEAEEISEYDLSRILVEQQQLPFLDLQTYQFHRDLVKKFKTEFLHDNALLPLEDFGGRFAFACQEVPGPNVMEKLREHSPNGVYFFTALASEIKRNLHEIVPLDEKARAALAARATGEDVPDEQGNAWQSLFDAANESVLADNQPGDEEG